MLQIIMKHKDFRSLKEYELLIFFTLLGNFQDGIPVQRAASCAMLDLDENVKLPLFKVSIYQNGSTSVSSAKEIELGSLIWMDV